MHIYHAIFEVIVINSRNFLYVAPTYLLLSRVSAVKI